MKVNRNSARLTMLEHRRLSRERPAASSAVRLWPTNMQLSQCLVLAFGVVLLLRSVTDIGGKVSGVLSLGRGALREASIDILINGGCSQHTGASQCQCMTHCCVLTEYGMMVAQLLM